MERFRKCYEHYETTKTKMIYTNAALDQNWFENLSSGKLHRNKYKNAIWIAKYIVGKGWSSRLSFLKSTITSLFRFIRHCFPQPTDFTRKLLSQSIHLPPDRISNKTSPPCAAPSPRDNVPFSRIWTITKQIIQNPSRQPLATTILLIFFVTIQGINQEERLFMESLPLRQSVKKVSQCLRSWTT